MKKVIRTDARYEFTGWSMLGKPMMMYGDGDKLYIFAQLQVKKTWATFDGTYEPKNWKSWRMLIIDFGSGDVYLIHTRLIHSPIRSRETPKNQTLQSLVNHGPTIGT